MEDISTRPPPDQTVELAEQPRGLKFLLGTWTGRILLFNTIVFLIMSWQSGSFLMPTTEVLVRFGAKDPVLLAQGEYWHFLTPIFVHIGLLHYMFNTWALYVVAYQIEYLLRARWFLIVYLVSGIFGNIASSVFSLAMSAGASGALFGLLGAGLLIERTLYQRTTKTWQKKQIGAYTTMVVANLALGLMVPQIDNAAHIGGLVAGIALTYALTRIVPNRLCPVRPMRGYAALAFIGVLGLIGALIGSSPAYLQKRLEEKAVRAPNLAERFHYVSELVRLKPDSVQYRARRCRLLLTAGYQDEAAADLEALSRMPGGFQALLEMRAELETKGLTGEAEFVSRYLKSESTP